MTDAPTPKATSSADDFRDQILADVRDLLLKPIRHEKSDHINGGLPPIKIAPVTGTGQHAAEGCVLTILDGIAQWVHP